MGGVAVHVAQDVRVASSFLQDAQKYPLCRVGAQATLDAADRFRCLPRSL